MRDRRGDVTEVDHAGEPTIEGQEIVGVEVSVEPAGLIFELLRPERMIPGGQGHATIGGRLEEGDSLSGHIVSSVERNAAVGVDRGISRCLGMEGSEKAP